MTVVAAAAVEETELYRRYKSLMLSAGAALVLGASVEALADALDELVRDAEGTACAEPAARLRRLVEGAGAGEAGDDDLDAVRASHRAFRRRIWTSQPCEYVPCCAGTHRHDEETS
jgi:hypothetical protein